MDSPEASFDVLVARLRAEVQKSSAVRVAADLGVTAQAVTDYIERKYEPKGRVVLRAIRLYPGLFEQLAQNNAA